MGIINPQGFLPPASPELMSDVAILAHLAQPPWDRNHHQLAWLCGRLQLDPGCNLQSDSGIREL